MPSSARGERSLVSLATLFATGGDKYQVLARPDPLILRPALHSADSDGDGKLSLTELLRVIELYNTRNGTVRTGQYTMQDGTEDGYIAGPGGGVVTVFHSADTNRDGKLSLTELLRVIELYNYRSGTVRTGQYHVLGGTEDGFATGP